MIGGILKKVGCKSEAGQALVETALTLPLYLLILLGATDMAHLAFGAIEVANAAKAAVAYGSQNSGTAQDSTGIRTAASDETTNLVSSLTTTPSVAVVCSDGTVPADSTTGPPWSNTDCSTSQIELMLTVTTSASVSNLVTVPGLPSSFTVHGYAVQRVLSY